MSPVIDSPTLSRHGDTPLFQVPDRSGSSFDPSRVPLLKQPRDRPPSNITRRCARGGKRGAAGSPKTIDPDAPAFVVRRAADFSRFALDDGQLQTTWPGRGSGNGSLLAASCRYPLLASRQTCELQVYIKNFALPYCRSTAVPFRRRAQNVARTQLVQSYSTRAAPIGVVWEPRQVYQAPGPTPLFWTSKALFLASFTGRVLVRFVAYSVTFSSVTQTHPLSTRTKPNAPTLAPASSINRFKNASSASSVTVARCASFPPQQGGSPKMY